jgi:hypothetical protein
MKKVFTILSIFFASQTMGQQIFVDGQSATRKFIGIEPQFNFFRDWSTQAEFKSGIGEYVHFFPVELKNLRTGEKLNALQLEMMVKTADPSASIGGFGMRKKDETTSFAYIGLDEVNDFISFLEKNVVPNLGLSLNNKSSEFIFKAKEMVFYYTVVEKEKRISISIPVIDENTQASTGKFLYFWTEKNVEDIPNLVKVLKAAVAKKK